MQAARKKLDHTNPDQAVNFRDAGAWLNLLADASLLPERRIYRGGAIRHIRSIDVIENPRTIFNLQFRPDPEFPGVTSFHFPIAHDWDKYDTGAPEVREWLRKMVATVEGGIEYPLYIHCFSGKDSTGVVVAALLLILGIDTSVIVEEYLLSDGAVDRRWIEAALEGMKEVERYFSGIDLDRVRRQLEGAG